MSRPGRVAAQLAEDIVMHGVAYELLVPPHLGEPGQHSSLRLDPSLIVVHYPDYLAKRIHARRLSTRMQTATRVAKSTLFLITVLGYAAVLILRTDAGPMPGSVGFGYAVLGLWAALTVMSVLRTPVTHALRLCILVALACCLSWGLAWNAIEVRPQAAVLLAYPTGMCWIELAGALITRREERGTDERSEA